MFGACKRTHPMTRWGNGHELRAKRSAKDTFIFEIAVIGGTRTIQSSSLADSMSLPEDPLALQAKRSEL